MSLVKSPEMTEANRAAHQANGCKGQGFVTPLGKARSAAANLQHGFYSREQIEMIIRLGEDPEDYRRMMESLVEDLQPRQGLEFQLVLQMGQTLWRMKRAERMQDGLALRRIHKKLLSEELVTSQLAAQAATHLEPYARLQEALAPRGEGPSPADIDAFLSRCSDRSSPQGQQLAALLDTLKKPLAAPERKAVLRQARALLKHLKQAFEAMAYRLAGQADDVHSPQSYAALMAPDQESSIFMQRMEDASLRRFWRLTNTLAKIRQGALTPKDVKNDDRSGDVYENKDSHDIITENKTDNVPENTEFLPKNAAA